MDRNNRSKYLCHFNPFHNPKNGQFSSSKNGVKNSKKEAKRIREHFGTSKYINADGSLTEEGQRRYEKDKAHNDKQKAKNKLSEAALKDPDRWVKEDLETSKQLANTGSKVVQKFKEFERETRPAPVKTKFDLSSMSDQELRSAINRELLERQYNDVFGTETQEISRGRKYVQNALDATEAALSITGSAIEMALAIKQLKD